MDFFTFLIIAIFVYNLFGKKDKPPQRRQPPAQGRKKSSDSSAPIPGSPQPESEEKESIFETLEKQIKESAEKFERELKGEPKQSRPVPEKSLPRKYTSQQSPVSSSEDYEKRLEPGSKNDKGTRTSRSQERLEGKESTPGYERSYSGVTVAVSKDARIKQKEIASSPIYVHQNRLAKNLGFSSSAVVQGIIWSEILKEPKGRKGFKRK